MPVVLPSCVQGRDDGADGGPYPSLDQESTPVSIVPRRQTPRLGVGVALEHIAAAEQDGVLFWCEIYLPLGLIAHPLLEELSHLHEQHSGVVRTTVLEVVARQPQPGDHDLDGVLAVRCHRWADVQPQPQLDTGEAQTEKNLVRLPLDVSP